MTQRGFYWFLLCATLLTLCVVALGAWVRLSHAGLGCPDWPGCYGSLIVPDQTTAQMHVDYTGRPMEKGKAWKEMIHRYAAGLLGLLILAASIVSWQRHLRHLRTVSAMTLALTILQALLGMWTVTLLLKPIVVVAHLLGGMSILALLFWMCLRQRAMVNLGHVTRRNPLLPWVCIGLLVLSMQIALGGWVSSNYAALACPDFPKCQGKWLPEVDFKSGFRPWHGLGIDYEGGILLADARTAIHLAHRVGAVIALLILGSLAIACMRKGLPFSRLGWILLGLLFVQCGLGIANVLLRLPLPVATGHNVVAASLLLCLVALLHQCCPLSSRHDAIK
ncbi:MAG: COX15/CtaA family protein [Candidatus Eutrophobiaceae bacterium]